MIDRFAATRLLFLLSRTRPNARSTLKRNRQPAVIPETEVFGYADHGALLLGLDSEEPP